MKKFSYKQRSAEDLIKRAEQSSKQFDSAYKDSVKLFKPVDGENAIRILPPTWDNARHYGLDVYFHYSIGEDQQTYICPLKMNVSECPICEELKTIKPTNKEEEALVASRKPGKRVLMWVIDRNNESDGPLLYPMPWTMDKDISTASIDPRTREILNIDDPENGFDVFFTKTGKGIGTKYTGTRIDRRESVLSDDVKQVSNWLQTITATPVTESFVIYTYDKISAAFSGKVSTKQDEVPPASKRKPMTEVEEDENESLAFQARMAMSDSDPDRDEDELEETDEDDVLEEELPETPKMSLTGGKAKLSAGLSKLRSK